MASKDSGTGRARAVGLILILAVWGSLAFAFGAYDLQISEAIVHEGTVPGTFVEYFGELPGYGLIAMCAVIAAGCLTGDLGIRRKVVAVGVFSGLMILALGILLDFWQMVFAGGAVSISVTLLPILMPVEKWPTYRRLSHKVLYLATIVPLLFVQVMKVVSGRIRYNDLVPDHSDFTRWYVFNGIDLHNSSFPSGHTAMAWMSLPLLFFIWNGGYSKEMKFFASFVIIGWGLFVAVNRVLIGDHYASDVLFSTGMAFLAAYLLHSYMKKDDV